ncbi:hypothetical protein VNO77_34267 [Canavalia gladiata]|uniref:Uncharacterized protein n=1 Tax=Canavalia gladiata TaxID=3824 RepID=A0AAN9KH94_CANGL
MRFPSDESKLSSELMLQGSDPIFLQQEFLHHSRFTLSRSGSFDQIILLNGVKSPVYIAVKNCSNVEVYVLAEEDSHQLNGIPTVISLYGAHPVFPILYGSINADTGSSM